MKTGQRLLFGLGLVLALAAGASAAGMGTAFTYQGFLEDGVYEIDSKVGMRTGMRRQVVFSDEAMEHFNEIAPRWSRLDSYSQAVRDLGRGSSGRLRHSAATHIHRAGASRADVSILLGHLPGRVSLTYSPIDWRPLRVTAGLLTLRPST